MTSTPDSVFPSRVIIVGASSGMGAALARQLATRGSRVAAVARRADQLDARARPPRPIASAAYAFDATDVGAVARALRAHRRAISAGSTR